MSKKFKLLIILLLILIAIILFKNANVIAIDENYLAKTYIDNPKSNSIENGVMNIEGWIMSNDIQSKIKIYIDEEEQIIENFNRSEREDVLKSMQGYGGKDENPTPGFSCTININNLTEGKHTLKVKVFSRDDILLAEHSRTFKIEKYVSKMYIDSVGKNDILKVGDVIQGWAMSNDESITFKVYIDEEEQIIEKVERENREDVQKAIYGYGDINQNPMPGFNIKVDINKLTNGTHNLKMQVISRNGEVLTEWKQQFNIDKYEAKMYIDKPVRNSQEGKLINVSGWIMSNDENVKIKAYIDDKEKEIQNIKRSTRTDVIKAIEGYGGIEYNPAPGFEFQINIEDGLKDGQHEFKIEVYSRENELLEAATKNIKIKKYDGKVYIDNPVTDERVKTNVYVRGWKMTEDENAQIKISINGKEQENIKIESESREDVLKAVQGYGGKQKNPKPGFVANIDVSNLLDGKYTLKIDIVSKLGEIIATVQREIIVKKYDTKICIDSPQTSYVSGNSVYVRGWVMSELKNKQVVIKIDDEKIEGVNSEQRPDVLEIIKNYGGQENNEIPGFNAQIDLTKYEKGEHTITIEVHSNEMEETIERVQIKITDKKPIVQETGSYGISGIWIKGQIGGSELTYYRFGSGPNVFFATFCVHGYEDSWDKDGTVLVNIANDFYNRLKKDQDNDLADKWTIYIFPEVNPDGRRLGYTKNGPGRTTLFSKVEKGIDINRSWQTGSSYQRYTDVRNYNGTSGFQAYEAEYLRNFLLSNKSKTGQTVLVDLHGWEDQLIGDEQICNYYKQQYTSCSTRNYNKYGTQYLISWARQNLGAKVSLVELPLAANQAQVDSMQLSNKYINATLKMLKEV